MSDVKSCDSCGTGLSLKDMFCHNCGKKQVAIVQNEVSATDGSINREATSDLTINNAELETEKTEAVGEKDLSSLESQPEAKGDETAVVENDSAVDPQLQVTYQDQPQPQHQQPPFAQQAAPEPALKKKKFPWFFTVLWLLTFAAVGIWGFFLLVDQNYDFPIFTVEAQRYVIFTAAVAVLIYTLSLKLAIKKLKAIPAILLVLFSIAIFVLFCLVELQDGDFLHDMVSNLVESVIPAFGE